MNRKKNITKLFLLSWIVVWVFWYIQSEAINLTLNFNNSPYTVDSAKTDMSIRPIHFKEFENDFGWLFYFNKLDSIFNPSQEDGSEPEDPDTDSEESQYKYTITDGSSSVSCKSQIEWFYYNAERWERLRPLDEGTMETWHMDEQWLTMTWWIYTNCTPKLGDYITALSGCNENNWWYGSEEECAQAVKNNFLDIYSYYWGVTHEYSGQTFILAVWINYDEWTPRIEPKSEIWKTFQWHPEEWNNLPFGLIYDNLWWVWFAWCEIVEETSPATILNDIIRALVDKPEIYTLFTVNTWDADGKRYLVYTDDINASSQRIDCLNVWQDNTSALKILVEWLIWMWKEQDIGYYKTMDGGKVALKKTQYFASTNINNATLINYARQRAEILCRWKWENSNPTPTITTGINCISGSIDLGETNRNKTIIVRNWDVTIRPFSQGNSNDYYDIFIDNGNLKIDEDGAGAGAGKFVIWVNGFYSSDNISGFNLAINNLMNDAGIAITDKYNNIQEIWVASILKWNFIVNWHIGAAGTNTWLNNKYFIYGKLTTLDNNDVLNKTFAWRCNYGWSNETSKNACPGPNVWEKPNPYQDAPLVIIDQNYNSPLLKY